MTRHVLPAVLIAVDPVVARASSSVGDQVERSSLLVAEERYVQEIRRPDTNPEGGNLLRTDQIDEHDVAGNADEVAGTTTDTSFRRFTVNTADALRPPPPQ